MLKELITPDMIDISGGLCGSKLGKSETESVVRNIITICRRKGKWIDFTWGTYQELCDHSPSPGEGQELGNLHKMKLLSYQYKDTYHDGKYHIQDALIAELWEFVKPVERTINSTDKQKLVIHKMFAEPIDKVQVAMNELVMEESGLSISTDYHLRLNHYMGTLQVKIDNLKAMLPVIQDEP